MKPSEARKLSPDEIVAEVNKRREELLDLRFQASVGQANNPKRIRTAKREIARLLTVANESARQNASQSANGNINRNANQNASQSANQSAERTRGSAIRRIINPRDRGGA